MTLQTLQDNLTNNYLIMRYFGNEKGLSKIPTKIKTMSGVRFNVANHASNSVPLPKHPVRSAYDLLRQTWGTKWTGSHLTELLQNSFGAGEQTDFSSIIGQPNGFVHTIIRAYNTHHHLVLRPDDVWIAVLGQFHL